MTLQAAIMTTDDAVSILSGNLASSWTQPFHTKTPKMYAIISAPEPNFDVKRPPTMPKRQATDVSAHGKKFPKMLYNATFDRSKLPSISTQASSGGARLVE